MTVYKSLFGHVQADADIYNDALKSVKDNIRVMETALKNKEYLVGNSITVADVVIAMSLTMAF